MVRSQSWRGGEGCQRMIVSLEISAAQSIVQHGGRRIAVGYNANKLRRDIDSGRDRLFISRSNLEERILFVLPVAVAAARAGRGNWLGAFLLENTRSARTLA